MSTVGLAALKRRRGAIKASITKLTTKITELEAKEHDPSVLAHAQQLGKRLENLDSDFNTRHFAVIDVLEDEEQLTLEQDVLDNHDDELAELNLRLQALMVPTISAPLPTPTDSDSRPLLSLSDDQHNSKLVLSLYMRR